MSGWGVDFSHIRSLGSSIGGQKNRSGGKVPFAKIYNDVLLAYNQGGKRPGAATLYISCWDIDVFDFIDLRKSSGDERRRARDLFPAIVVDDVFMSRVDNDEEYTLFDPYDTPELLDTFGEEFANHYLRYEKEFKENSDKFNINTNTIEARKLFRYIVTSYNQDGVPFLFFKDNANKAHEHKELGLIKQSNLCIVGDHKIMTEKSLDPMNPEVKTIAELSHLSNGHKAFNTYSMAYDASKKSWSLQVKEAVAFKTGLQRPYARVVLMDGSIVKCTDEHKFILEDGTKCMAKDLFGKTVMTLNGGVKVAEVVPEVDGVFEDVYDLSVKDNHNFIIDTGKSKVLVSNCVTPDTLVLTKLYGHKPIGELVESGITETECWNGEEWSMTKLFKTSDNDKVVKVKLNNEAVIECTLDHDWWLEGNNGELIKIKTKDLKPGDKLIRSNYPKEFLDKGMKPGVEILVVSIEDEGKFSPTYCGNEPKRHMLTFNGILTGQCMEIIQPTDYNKTAVCNLGSFNLAKLRFNTERMKEVAKLATRAMDNYIDLTDYPSEKSKRTQLERRSIGGGFLGEAELMATSKIMYGSQEHRDAIDLIYGTISSAVREATRELAKEKGSCIVEGVRNAYLMAIAPNSSSGILASTTNCHEPVYSRIWVEGSKLDEIVMTAPNITPENEKYYVTAFEVPMDTQIELVAQRQKYIDMSISCNLYFNPQNLSIRNIAEVIIKAWKLGCKTTYYLKSKAMSNDDINTDNKNVPLKKENNGIRCVGCEN